MYSHFVRHLFQRSCNTSTVLYIEGSVSQISRYTIPLKGLVKFLDHLSSNDHTMESRRHSCRQCGLQLPAPTGAKAIYCPRCQRFTQFQPKNNMHGAPTVNANGPYSNNINAMNTGLPVYPAKPRTVTSGFGYGNYRPESFQIRSPQVMRPQPPPAVHGRKRAVLCGANYRGHNKSLKGSINDVLAMRYLLVDKLGFPNASVIVLTGITNSIYVNACFSISLRE